MLAYSSGNHAQGVAIACKMLGLDALIVMPNTTPALKVNATRGYGAKIVFVDRFKQDIDTFVE